MQWGDQDLIKSSRSFVKIRGRMAPHNSTWNSMELAVMLHATPLRGCRLRLQIAFAIAPTEIPAASRRRITALPAGRAQQQARAPLTRL